VVSSHLLLSPSYTGYQAKARDLEDFDPEKMIASKLVVFILATYGEGDPTDNAMNFAKWIQDYDGALGNQGLCNMQYAVFGLGSTQYEHYNKMGIDTDARLSDLGAERIYRLGLGDDNGTTLEEDFDKWREELWPALAEKLGNKNEDESATSSTTITESLPDLPFTLTIHKDGSTLPKRHFEDSEVNTSTKYYFHSVEAPVTVNRELRQPADGGSTRHIEIDIAGTGLQYLTADNLAVLPHNSSTGVSALAMAMGYNLNDTIVMENGKALFPTPCTVRDALTKYTDLHGIPRRSTLAQLAFFAKDNEEKTRLQFLASKGGREEYKSFVEQAGRSLLELITSSFPSLQIPLDHFINLARSLQPRYYTISSSSSVNPSSIHITVAVTQTPLPGGRVHQGVCSTYLASPATKSLRIFVRPSTFRLPALPSTPIIMIGPGTGIAPMRAMLQERHHAKEVRREAVGENILFFGCRRRDHDFIYEEELRAFEKSGALTDLQLAFSRETEKKVYVQHLISKPETASRLWKLISEEKAHVYICGATSMGHDVHKALQDVITSNGESGAEVLKRMQAEGRYVQELWSA